MDLRQRKLFTIREFTFEENGIHIKVKNLISSQEFDIPFEEMNLKKIIRQKKTDALIVIVGAFFGLVLLISLTNKIFSNTETTWGTVFVFFIFTTLSGFIAYLNFKRQILIPTSNSGILYIFDGRPTKEITERFIDNLTLKSNIYLKRKYGSIDRDLPAEPQLRNLMWLKEKDILKENEFEELKNKLLGKRDNINPIGFR